MSFLIMRASPKDAKAMAEISAAAFENDTHTKVKALSGKPNAFSEGMAAGISQWIESERCVVLKAVDPRDGAIVGHISWAFRGIPPPAVPVQGEAVEPDLASPHPEHTQSVQPDPPSEWTDKIAALESITNADMARWIEKIMPEGTKCMYMVASSVHPEHQGRGIGSQMIRWGTTIADATGVFCWVHSSEAAWRTFEKHGFKEVERLTVHLDDYAAMSRSDSADGNWGDYTFHYMVRQPLAH